MTKRNLIYIADDDKSIRDVIPLMIESLFPKYNERIKVFEDGEALYDKLQIDNEQAKLILTDINMPKMDGFALTQKCKEAYPTIPVIAMSGKFDNRMLVLEAGAKDFLSKPFNLKKLESTLEKYL